MRSNHSSPPPFDDLTDTEWLVRIAGGDEEAFRLLRDRYAGLLFAGIYRLLGDRSEAEEVLQEVMVKIWRKGGQYHPGRGRPVTWLTTTARHRAIDRLRARGRQTRLKEACASAPEFVPRGSFPVAGPEAASRRDACAAVRSAVLELSPIQREAIDKAYFEGLSQQEIADQIGEPLGTVKARVRRGLAKLRDRLDR